MPKIVDHDQRREQIVDAMWRLIERGGFESATMREIAAEAGFAHGALARYFRNKEELLAAAFVRAQERTNARAAARSRDLRGLEALRALCLEIMPVGRERRQEARVVVAFWDRAVQDGDLWRMHRENATSWREQMYGFLAQAREDGQIGLVDDETVVDQIMAMNAGWQMLCLLMPDTASQRRQYAALDRLLDGLREGAPERQSAD